MIYKKDDIHESPFSIEVAKELCVIRAMILYELIDTMEQDYELPCGYVFYESSHTIESLHDEFNYLSHNRLCYMLKNLQEEGFIHPEIVDQEQKAIWINIIKYQRIVNKENPTIDDVINWDKYMDDSDQSYYDFFDINLKNNMPYPKWFIDESFNHLFLFNWELMESGHVSKSFHLSMGKFCKEIMNIEYNSLKKSGVYIIGDFYIGRSKDISSRLMYHLNYSIKGEHTNKEMQDRIMSKILNDKKLSIKIISDNQDDEEKLIYDYYEKGYPLINKQFLDSYKKQLT